MPGDELPNGVKLRSLNCAGLQVYAQPMKVASTELSCQFVFQCRQMPRKRENPAFTVQDEFMGIKDLWGRGQLCPHVPIDKIERITTLRQAVVPHGILVQRYETSRPPTEAFDSSVGDWQKLMLF